MSGRMVTFSVWAGASGVLSAAAGAPALHAQQQVQVVVTAVPNPVAAGTCAGIWAEVRNAQNQRLIELNGMPLHSRSYDFSVSSAPGVAWRDNDPASGYLCVQAGAPVASIQVMATVRSTPFSGATIVAIQAAGAPPVAPANPQVAAGYPSGATGGPQPTYAQPVANAAPVSGAPQPGYVPTPGAPAGAQPSYPQAGYAQPGSAQPQSAQPSSVQPAGSGSQQNGYAQPAAVNPYAPMQTQEPGAPYAAPATAAGPSPSYAPQPNSGAPGQGEAAQKGVGGFLRRFGNHVKQKAGELTTQTAQNLAGSATQLIDTTLQTGSGLVSTTVAGAGNTARMTVGGAGRSLIPSALRGSETSDNLASAVAGGRAILRAMRFQAGTAVLEPSAQELAARLAEELKKVLLATPGTYLLSAHVDPILTPAGAPIPSASQQLSERRAAALKAVLVKHGVPSAQVIALGYGASQPLPETSADGTVSSARVEIARTQ